MADIKAKIISYDGERRAMVVQYYTDELVAAYPEELARRVDLELQSGRYEGMSQDQVIAICEDTWRCGDWKSIPVPDPLPTGQALTDYVLSWASWSFLEQMSKVAVRGPDDLSALDQLIGQEFVGVPPQVRQQEEETIIGEVIAKAIAV